MQSGSQGPSRTTGWGTKGVGVTGRTGGGGSAHAVSSNAMASSRGIEGIVNPRSLARRDSSRAMLEGDAGWPASCLTMSFSGKGGLQTAPTSFVALDLRGHRWLSMTAPFTFPRVRGNQKGASPACGGIGRGV